MKYQTQKVALLYFYGALGLFLAQVLFGVLAGTIYVLPNTLSELLPFNIVRMVHTNALIVWLLMGFMGATYYLIPEETETELFSPMLAKVQFWLFLVAAAAAVVGYLFKKLKYPLAPLVLALVLGDMAETAFRQSMLLSGGSTAIFFSNALVGSIVTLAILLLCWPLVGLVLDRMRKAEGGPARRVDV